MKGHRKNSESAGTYKTNKKGEKNMKKAIALILALTLVFGTMSFALAAPSDVEGTKYEDAVARLSGLKILLGYPDGTFKPENSITRAEFATIAVKLLGLANAAEYAKGATQFSDVAADHWASGFVNIAVNKGVIVGYPDGTFKPENNVTYAEAVTMLVRVLGYGPATAEEGTWPANYIAKGAELGVTEGINFYGYVPAKRGDVALMSDNSLDIPLMVRVGYGDEATYKIEKDQTLLSEKLNAYSAKAVLLADKLVDNSLDEDELAIVETKINGVDTTKLTVAEDFEFDFAAHIGEELKFWFNEDDEVFNVETSSDVVYSRISALAADEITVVDPEDEDETKAYDYKSGFGDDNVFINLDDTKGKADLAAGMDVKLVLNDDDEVVYVVATDWTVKLVEDVDVEDEEIEVAGTDIDLAGHEYDVDLDDINEDDIIYYYSKDTGKDDEDGNNILKYFIVIADEKVEGELEAVGSSNFTVDGEDIDFGALAGTYNDADALKGILGKEVKVLLDKYGDAYKVVLLEDEEEAANYALVIDVAAEEDRYGNDTGYIKVLTAAGEKVEYKVADDAIIKSGATKVDMSKSGSTITENTDVLTFSDGTNTLSVKENNKDGVSVTDSFVIKYELNADGEIDLVEIVDLGTAIANARADQDEETLANMAVENDTVFFDAINEAVIELADFKEGVDYTVYTVKEGTFDDLKLVVYADTVDGLADETEYAIYLSNKTVVDGFKIKLLMNGEETWYFASDDDISAPTQLKGDFVEVEFDGGDIVNIATKAFTKSDLVIEEVDYANNRMLVKEGVSTFVIKVNADTVIFDKSDIDNIKEVEFGDLDDEMTINYLENSDKAGYAKVIVVK